MSTLVVQNISSSGIITSSSISDGTTTINATDVSIGGATAWCRFDSTGSGLIEDSYNVSSLTDINTGRWRVNFTTAMDVDKYVALGNASGTTNTSTDTWINAYNLDLSGCSFGIYNASGTHVDRSIVCVAFFGGKS